jgi:hypothetical protein
MDYFASFDTGNNDGGDDDDEIEAYAEEVSEHIIGNADESDIIDTGAGLELGGGLAALLANPAKMLQGVLGLGVPQAKAQKVVKKLKAKVPAKIKARPKAAIVRPRAPAPLMLPRSPLALPPRPAGASVTGKLLSMPELLDRIEVAQLAGYAGEIEAGATTAIELDVSRNGMVIQWSVNDDSDSIIVQTALTYCQVTNTIYRPQSLGAWGSKAAHRTPINPIHVTSPNVFNTSLFNNTSTAIYVVWTMMGIADDMITSVMQDPDVARTLVHRKMVLSTGFAGLGF